MRLTLLYSEHFHVIKENATHSSDVAECVSNSFWKTMAAHCSVEYTHTNNTCC